MARQYKIKHYKHRLGSANRARINPFRIILTLLVVGGLVFVGVSIYDPVYRLLMGEYKPSPEVLSSTGEEPEAPVQEESQDTQPQTEQPAVPAAELNIVFMPTATARSEEALGAFLEDLEGTDVNAVMIDIKDKQGNILFDTKNENAEEWGAVAESVIDLASFHSVLERNNLALAVRMPAFQDPLAARAERDNAIRYQDGEWLWLDNTEAAGGKPWLNPYAPGARKYATDLAVEATRLGAALVVLEDVQFPDGSLSTNATFGGYSTGSRLEALAGFVREITAAVEAEGGTLGVYVPAVATSHTTANETRFGGNPLDIVDNTVILGLLPYQFGSGYDQAGLTVSQPMQDPTATVKTALDYVQDLLNQRSKSPRIIPLLQGGTESAISATVVDQAMIQAMIDAVQDQGCQGYLLYQLAGEYALSA